MNGHIIANKIACKIWQFILCLNILSSEYIGTVVMTFVDLVLAMFVGIAFVTFVDAQTAAFKI